MDERERERILGSINSGLAEVLLNKFSGMKVSYDLADSIQIFTEELLRGLLDGIDDNPPIDLTVTIERNNVTITPDNFYTFLVMNGVTIHHMVIAGATEWTNGSVIFRQLPGGKYGIVVPEPIEHPLYSFDENASNS